MERAQHRVSRSGAGSEGNRHNQKQRVTKKFLSESYTSIDGTAKEDMEMLKKENSSSQRVNGTPMKKLLAEEMSKDMETKRRSPSVIARLMGLDGLPSPQHGYRQSLSGNHRISGPIGVQEDDHLRGRSSRRISMEHQEFKDVCEDLEASHIANRRYSSSWRLNPSSKEPEMFLPQQKSKHAKRLSTNDKLTLGVVDLNKELLLKYLEEPDSLSAKHVNDLQHDTSSTQCNLIAILKPSNPVKCEGNAKAWKSERDIVCNHDVDSHRKRKDGLLLHSVSHHSARETLKSSKHESEEKSLKRNLPTQIVLLMPGKKINVKSSILSPDSLLAYPPDNRHTKYPSFETVPLREKRDLSNLVGSSRPKRKEAKELAKKVTTVVRENFETVALREKGDLSNLVGSSKCKEAKELAKKVTTVVRENFENSDSGPINLTCPGIKGYAGDESSYDGYDSDSDSVSDVRMFSCRTSFGWKSQNKNSNSTFIESSVNREAKKRLSERWKITHRCQDEEICSKGSTLGEMLAIPHKGKKLEHLNAVSSGDGANNGFLDMSTGCAGPSGISSRDGWKDGCKKRASRARSLPPSLGGRSQKTRERQDALPDNQYLVTRDTMGGRSSKAPKGNLRRKERSAAKESRSGGKKPLSCQDKFVVNSDSSTKTKFSKIETEIDLEKVETSKEQPSCEPISYLDLMPEVSSSMIQSGDSSAGDQDHSNLQEVSTILSEEGSYPLQCPDPEPESSETSKEADHSSPVSVLEVAIKEEKSSGPECFERVSAELQGLRRQLQLLKMESEVDAVEACPWVKPAIEKVGSVGKKHGLMDAENNLLADEENSRTRVAPERMLDREMEWYDFRDDIDTVGKEIEKLLIDELLMEVVTM